MRICTCEGPTEMRASIIFDEEGHPFQVCDALCTNCGGFAEKPEQLVTLNRFSSSINVRFPYAHP